MYASITKVAGSSASLRVASGKPKIPQIYRYTGNSYTCLFLLVSLAVESKKRAERRRNWYSKDIGIKICEMFHTITYTKST